MNIPAKAYHFAQTIYQEYPDNQGVAFSSKETFIAQQLLHQQSQLSAEHRQAILNGNSQRQLSAFIQLQAKNLGIESGLIVSAPPTAYFA